MKKRGIVMHVSSLPSPYGIGTIGKAAYDFVDFLAQSNINIWQVLPIGQTGYGDSPYQSFSAFAGNPYFIDLDLLVESELLNESDIIDSETSFDKVDYGRLYVERYKVLKKSFDKSYSDLKKDVEEFEKSNFWILDYALFMALKDEFGGKSWLDWDDDIRMREPSVVEKYRKKLEGQINFYCYLQYLFYMQWGKLKSYANAMGVEICGDMPIYCSMDSSDVWQNPKCFQLDENLRPTNVAGVPPDYFSEDGQLWGNPLFDWDYLKKTNFDFWVKRVKGAEKLFNILRIDHFIGFANYYSIDANEVSAKKGCWRDGPSVDLFEEINKNISGLRIIAEDLGVVNQKVIDLRKHFNFPGMKVLTFMLDPNEATVTKIADIEPNTIMYTGTHDNDTTLGWWKSQDEKTQQAILKMLSLDDDSNIVYDLIKICMNSNAETVIIPIQDYLILDTDSRMNTPGVASNNWQFRVQSSDLTDELAGKIKDVAKT